MTTIRTTAPSKATPLAMPRITVADEGLRAAQRRMALVTIVVPTLGALLTLILALIQGVNRMEVGLLVGMFFLTTLGIEVGFHRMIAHRAFKAPAAVKVALVVLGSLAAEGSVLYWAAGHRRHHAHSDTGDDPHSPHIRNLGESDEPMNALVGLWHAHFAWMMRDRVTNCTLFARDVLREPTLNLVHRLYIPLVLAGLAVPSVIGGVLTGSLVGVLQGLLWGGLLRMFLVHQSSWANASFGHRYGSRPFATGDHSANNRWLAVPTFGASWQNNHHAFPSSAFLGLCWQQVDVGGLCIRVLTVLHLVSDVNGPPTEAMMAERRWGPGDSNPSLAASPATQSVSS